MSIYGADPDQLDTLARVFEDTADRLRRILTESRSLANQAVWVGADANTFRSQITEDLGSSVIRSAEGVRRGAEALRRNANEQRAASDPQGGATVGAATHRILGVGAAGSVIGGSVFRIDSPGDNNPNSIADVIMNGSAPAADWRDSPGISALIDLTNAHPPEMAGATISVGDLTPPMASSLTSSTSLPSTGTSAWIDQIFGVR